MTAVALCTRSAHSGFDSMKTVSNKHPGALGPRDVLLLDVA